MFLGLQVLQSRSDLRRLDRACYLGGSAVPTLGFAVSLSNDGAWLDCDLFLFSSPAG
jgi:hypothetical protein